MSELLLSTLNSLVQRSPEALVRSSEDNYRAFVDSVAERIVGNKKIRIVLLTGPSGSGKTTTANLLSDRIKSHGEECMVVSLDDFYRDFSDPEYPRLPCGERDLEACEALHLPDLVKTLLAIAEGEEFTLPRYDFKTSVRVEEKHYEPIEDGCVIIEGLHALNPLVFSSLPTEKLLKMFISVSTNIEDGKGGRLISGRKIRFIRRMVRDSIYRGADAERTLELWKNVLAGEDKYLYPNRVYADVIFDTFHPFELSVMRPLVENRISEELASRDEYAGTVLSAVRSVFPIDISLVPEDSLIREFIPGGIYEELY